MVCHLISAWMIVNCTSPAAMAKNSSVPRVLACINEIADWIASNRLMLKSSKIDLLWCSMRWYSDGVALTDVAQCVCWTIPSCPQPWRESRQGALTFYLRQPTGRLVLRTAAEHQDLPTSLDMHCSSHDGEQLHHLTNYCNSLLAACSQRRPAVSSN